MSTTTLPHRPRLHPAAFAPPVSQAQADPYNRTSTISAQSTLTAETPPTPPRTPSPLPSFAFDGIPSVNVIGVTQNDNHGKTSTAVLEDMKPRTRTVRKVRSAERTRSWAEEVERQRLRGEWHEEGKGKDKDKAREGFGKGLTVDTERDPNDIWHITTDVIDTMLGEDRYCSPALSAASVLSNMSNLSRRSEALLLSESDNDSDDAAKGDEPWRYRRDRSVSRNSRLPVEAHLLNTTRRRTKSEKTTLSRMPLGLGKSPNSNDVAPAVPPGQAMTPDPQSTAQGTTPSVISRTKKEILSIDEIVARHSGAVIGAFDAAKSKARKDLGLPSQKADPVPAGSNISGDRSNVIDSKSSLVDTQVRTVKVEQSDLTGLGISLPPRVDVNPRARVAGPSSRTGISDQDESRSIPAARVGADPLPANSKPAESYHPRTPSIPATIGDKSSDESVTEGMIMGQALLARLEIGANSSSPGLPGQQTPRPSYSRRTSLHHHSSTPPGSRTSSPVPDFGRLKRNSLPVRSDSPTSRTVSEQEAHAMAVYLRSSQLNRYLLLPRPSPERPLRVSLADIGDPSGTPVLIFLGIGCVRHLIALFDDLAKALKLRLICIDRWGFGKTESVPQEKREPMGWAVVVERVLAELEIENVKIIAHSAGAPYAAASAIKLGARVHGTINFLAPWISAEIDGGYKWLKWVPNGVIKSAFAAEWKLQSYRLGKPPPLVHEPVSHIAEKSLMTPLRPSLSRTASDNGTAASPVTRSSAYLQRTPSLARRASQMIGLQLSTNSNLNASPVSPGESIRSPPRLRGLRSMTPLRSKSDNAVPAQSYQTIGHGTGARTVSISTSSSSAKSVQIKSPDLGIDDLDILRTLQYSSPSPSPTSVCGEKENDKPQTSAALLHALEQASHAECEPGTTDDLMTIILNRPYRPWGFNYTDVKQPMRIWWGDEDDKVSEKSVRWMERSCVSKEGVQAQLKVVRGGDHNLMRSVPVMMEIFEGIAREAGGAK